MGRERLQGWGAPLGVAAGILAIVLLLGVAVANLFLLSQTHTLIVDAHLATLAVIRDELLRKTSGAVVIKSACIIVELVNKSLPAAQHISTKGCPPLPLSLLK